MPFIPAGVGTAVAAGAASAAVGAGISALTAGGQSSAIGSGASSANAVNQQAIATGTKNYNTDHAAFSPYVSTGQNALTQYANLEGLNGQSAANNALSQFQASPGYQYQVSEGERAVDQGAASQGILNSGATLKAEQTLGSNLANQDFTNYTNRLAGLAGMGLQGATGQNQATGTFNNLLTGQSNSIAGTDVSQGVANAGIYGNLGNSLGNAAGTAINSLYSPSTVQSVQPTNITPATITPTNSTIIPVG